MHTLIVGITNSGKSKLARNFATRADPSNDIVVFDPTRSTGWPETATKYYDPETFLDAIEEKESAYVFIDESKRLWDFDKERAEALVYSGRHRGLYLFLIAQRTMMISPNGRNMCSRIFAFKQQYSDAKILRDEYHDRMIDTAELAPVHFIFTDGFNIKRGHLEFDSDDPNAPARVVMDIRTVVDHTSNVADSGN